MKKPLLATLAIISASLGTALASPAEDLVKQASFYIGFYYNGPAKVPYWRELQKTMLTDVQKLCAGDAKCGYDKGVQVIKGYINTLNDPFTTLIPAREAEDVDRFVDGKGPSTPTIGLKARELPGQGLVVLEAFPGEPAFNAELARGDVIRTINGQPATLAGLRTAEDGGKAISLAYSNKGTAKTAQVTPVLVDDTRAPSRQSLAEGKVLMIRIPNFYGPIGTRVHSNAARAVTDKAQGVIIDLRDSESGFDSEALLAAGAFVKSGGFIYDNRFQGQDSTYTVENGIVSEKDEAGKSRPAGQAQRPTQYTGNVVVIVNKQTVNSSEMLAYFLQKPGRAKIVGETTAGQLASSGSSVGQLINDDYIQVSYLRMLNLDKTPFSPAITPDVVVPEDLAGLAQGRDVQLEKALELIGAK
jgi:carboxyl-terminal processing protease